MKESIWWVAQPPNIQMTDARARALIEGRSQPKNNDEWVFIQANASTMIPPATVKIIGPQESLGLSKPKKNAPLVYGEE